MSILKTLVEAIQSNDYFFFNSDSLHREREWLKQLAVDFLRSPSEREREFLSTMVTISSLIPHAKGSDIGLVSPILNAFELFRSYPHKGQRKHAIHQVNTYLIGLLIYHGVADFRDCLLKEVSAGNGPLSGGDDYGEFLFRWRLASLTHDLGTPLSLFGRNMPDIFRYLEYIQSLSNDHWAERADPIGSMRSLARSVDALHALHALWPALDLPGLFSRLQARPHLGSIYFDHGLMGALLLLKVIDRVYERHESGTEFIAGHHISYDRGFFDNSVLTAAAAIAVHNIDFYPAGTDGYWQCGKPFDCTVRPLAALLRLSDALQEWYKAKAGDESDFLDPDAVDIALTAKAIIVRRHPRCTELRTLVDSFFSCSGLIRVECCRVDATKTP